MKDSATSNGASGARATGRARRLVAGARRIARPAEPDYRGQTALVTGASSGIGAAFADAFAARGTHLILSARSVDVLAATARRLRAEHGVRVDVIPADLGAPGGADALARAVADAELDVDVLVNNAGVGGHGRFDATDPDRDARQLTLNVLSPTRLAHLFLPAMVARGRGTVINVASTSAFQAVPYMSVYGATKAFVLSLSIGLWAEYRDTPIAVLALCPGPTDTAFFTANDTAQTAVGDLRDVRQVVDTAFAGLARGRCYVVDGRGNYLTANLTRVLPRSALALITARVLAPRPAGTEAASTASAAGTAGAAGAARPAPASSAGPR
jgi:short-subunit dehydrogenase